MDSGRLGTNHDVTGRGVFCSALDFSGTLAVARSPRSIEGGIWTCDLRVMSPTSHQTAPPRVVGQDHQPRAAYVRPDLGVAERCRTGGAAPLFCMVRIEVLVAIVIPAWR